MVYEKPTHASEEHCCAQPKLKRRGLSKFYSSHSASFSSLELALGHLRTALGESTTSLGKSGSYSSNLAAESGPDSEAMTRSGSFGSSATTTSSGLSWASTALSSAVDDALCGEFIMALHLGRSAEGAHHQPLGRLSRRALHGQHGSAMVGLQGAQGGMGGQIARTSSALCHQGWSPPQSPESGIRVEEMGASMNIGAV
jgi:hypothetical protein